MLIALDARTIYRPQRRGTGKNLIDLYRQVARMRPDVHVLAFHRHPGPVETLNLRLNEPNIEPRHIEMGGDRWDAWEQWRLPWAAWRAGAQVLHCPANTCPDRSPVPVVVTIHDVIPLDADPSDSAFDPALVRGLRRSIQAARRGAAAIICPSHYTAGRLVNDFGVDRQLITVNPWAADSALMAEPASHPCGADRRGGLNEELAAKYGAEGTFVLHFGAREPRKNTRRLVEAWGAIAPKIRRSWRLVIVGVDGEFAGELARLAGEIGVAGEVCLNGFAGEDDLPALLRQASVLAYPSLSEGFGLPILDAFAAGTCVLCSDSTSLPEVAGDAALLVDAARTEAIAAGLACLIESPALRSALTQRGRNQLAYYSWEATAGRFLAVLDAVADGRQTLRPAA